MLRKSHMNLFHHYDHEGTIPYENNLSRGLAIILEEEPLMLSLFLNLINKRGLFIEYPADTYEVGFQTPCAEIKREYYENTKLYGITLTVDRLSNDKYENTKSKVDAITDIAITFDDTWIIVEVKRDSSDCRNQLVDQMLKCGCSETEIHHIASITWRDVMEIIRDFKNINRGRVSRIINDYYEEIDLQHPDWCPVSTFDLIDIDDDNRIKLRIEKIKKEYFKQPDVIDKYAEGGGMALDWGWASEVNLGVDDNYIDSKGNQMPVFWIGVWPGHKIPQFRLLMLESSLTCLDSEYHIIDMEKNGKFEVQIVPYVRLYTQLANSNIEIDFDKKSNMKEVIYNLRNEVGQHSREKWNILLSKIKESNAFTNEGYDELRQRFNAEYEQKKYLFVNFSVGLSVKLNIPYRYMQENDKDKEKQFTAKLIKESIQKIKELLMK